MKTSKYSNWWQAPSKATEVDEHRVVSTIELFCDLVFVAYVAVITHGLSADMSYHGLINFITRFTIGWVTWLNSSQYHDLHGNNDFKTRIITFLQMIFIGMMAAFSEESLDDGYIGFALSLAGVIIVLGTLWRGTGIADTTHQVYSKPYSRIYYFAAFFSLCSIGFPAAYRLIYLAAIALLMIMPMVTNYFIGDEEMKEDFISRMKLSNAFIERSNLFFIIVLGEIIIGSLNGFANHGLDLQAGILLLLSFLIAFGIWFTHFEFVGHLQHRETVSGYYMWLFAFFLETLTVTAIGSCIYLNYKHFSMEYLIIFTGIYFIATLLHFIFNKKLNNPNIKVDTTYTQRYILISLVILCLTYFIDVTWIQVLMYLHALYLPVLLGIRQWIKESKY